MFEKLHEIEKQIQEYTKYLQCGFYTVQKENQIIFTADKIESLKRELKAEENRIKKLYF